MKLKPTLALLCLIVLSSHSVFAEEEPSANTSKEPSAEKLEAIRELMQVTGAQANREEFSTAFTQQMLAMIRRNDPDLSEEAVKIVTDEVAIMVNKELDEESLQLMIFPIYAKYLTLDELNGLIEFNKSAVGKKANQVMPKLLEESLEAAQVWAQMICPNISDRVLVRFKEEGIPVGSNRN